MSSVPGLRRRPSSRPAWARDLGVRFCRLQWLKTLGITAFMWLFFVGYFALLRDPSRPVTTMPTTGLDAWIGFSPPWLWAYLSLWLYVGVPPGLMLRLRELVVYGLWAAGMAGVGLLCFYLWPTAVPRLTIDVSAFPGFSTLQGVDASGNACPSMHVAAAVFTLPWAWRVLRAASAPWPFHVLNVTWAAAIIYSTLAIKQHVLLDAVAGALLGGAFAALSMAFTPQPVPVQGAARVPAEKP